MESKRVSVIVISQQLKKNLHIFLLFLVFVNRKAHISLQRGINFKKYSILEDGNLKIC